jgi:hypothetical protein
MAEHWNGGNGGKGSKTRPPSVSLDKFDSNWDRIFSSKNEKISSKTDQTNQSFQPGEVVVSELPGNTDN